MPPARAGRSSRRAFVAAAGTAGAGALLAGCGATSDDAKGPGKGTGASDVRLLNLALDVEYRLLAAYTAAARLRVDRSARTTIEQLREHEREHVRGLGEAIKDLGGTPRAALPDSEYRTLLGLAALAGPEDVWRLGTRLENKAIAGYLEALPSLSSGQLRQTVSAVMASEAEHLTMIAGASDPGRPSAQVPAAFVTGRPG